MWLAFSYFYHLKVVTSKLSAVGVPSMRVSFLINFREQIELLIELVALYKVIFKIKYGDCVLVYITKT